MSETVPVHPVQNHYKYPVERKYLSQAVTLRAYEVYKAVHGEQKALIEGECRGGFGVGEIIAFLYAHTFPQAEWAKRCDEAFKGMKL